MIRRSRSAAGRSLRLKGDYDRATADASEAIRLDPKYTDGYLQRAAIFNSLRQYDRAMADASEAIRLSPQYAPALLERGIAFAGKGQLDDAIADLTKSIRIDAKYIQAFIARGEAYEAKGLKEYAIVDYRSALELPALQDRARKSQEVARDRLVRLAQQSPAPSVGADSPAPSAVLGGSVTGSDQASAQTGPYRIVDVEQNDSLNVRGGPSSEHSVVGAIPPTARGVRGKGACVGSWCPVQYGGVTGWVAQRYLAEDRESRSDWRSYVRDQLCARFVDGALVSQFAKKIIAEQKVERGQVTAARVSLVDSCNRCMIENIEKSITKDDLQLLQAILVLEKIPEESRNAYKVLQEYRGIFNNCYAEFIRSMKSTMTEWAR